MNEVYVLHFVGRDGEHYRQAGHAGHYIGYCARGVPSRLAYHRAGRGSRLLRAVAPNAELVVAFLTFGDRGLEKRMKRSKNGARYCPVCQGDARIRRHWKSGVMFTAFLPRRRAAYDQRIAELIAA